ncbi:MAG TPA: hypothetical protein VFS83_18085 [Ktedonobacterales bacterium]|nr:hypothetical protein [Ktedonobacterales bacterium]
MQPIAVDAHDERADQPPTNQRAEESWRDCDDCKEKRKVSIPGAECEWDPDARNEQDEHGDAPQRDERTCGCWTPERSTAARHHDDGTIGLL